MKAAVRDVQRALEILRGMLGSISADYKLSDEEISAIREWLDLHCNLLTVPPFDDLDDILNSILRDEVIEEHEREELLEWCQEFSDPYSAPLASISDSVNRLHGYLAGIVADKNVTDVEIRNLSDWLQDHIGLREHWPYCDVWAPVSRILEDKRITEAERAELFELCSQFEEKYAGDSGVQDVRDSEWHMITTAPVLVTFPGLTEENPVIEFPGKRFLMTGKSRAGTRQQLEELVEAAGGIVCGSARKDLDYLVVADLGSPQWAYSPYGKKIEIVVNRKRQGATTQIVSEGLFLKALDELASP